MATPDEPTPTDEDELDGDDQPEEGESPEWGDLDDPSTQARLAEWFGGTHGKRVEPAEPVEEMFSPEVRAAKAKAKAEAIAAVDPALLAAIDARASSGGEVIRPLPPLRLPLEDAAPRDFSPPAWGLRMAGDPREIGRSEEIADDLQICTPQAVLRDLYRPELFVDQVILRPIDLGLGSSPENARREVDAVIAVSYKWHPESSIWDDIRTELRDLRERLRAPWDKLDLPERPVLSPEERMAAMLGFGGSDPDA